MRGFSEKHADCSDLSVPGGLSFGPADRRNRGIKIAGEDGGHFLMVWVY